MRPMIAIFPDQESVILVASQFIEKSAASSKKKRRSCPLGGATDMLSESTVIYVTGCVKKQPLSVVLPRPLGRPQKSRCLRNPEPLSSIRMGRSSQMSPRAPGSATFIE